MSGFYDGIWDDDDVYDEDAVPFEESDESGKIKLKLFTDPNATAVKEQGGLKTFQVPKDAVRLNKSRRSNDYVTAERLLWADGWENSTIDVKLRRRMTLVILKFRFISMDDIKVSEFTARLCFKDKNKFRKQDPLVRAWAPFRESVRGGYLQADKKNTNTAEADVQAGWQGNQLSLKATKQGEISWTQIYSDLSTSGTTTNRNGQTNGVMWHVAKNPLAHKNGEGLDAELWVATLISRDSDEKYLVKFNLSVRSGTLSDYENNVKKLFGLPAGEDSLFEITPDPGKARWWSDEGEAIAKSGSIDLNNLGKLRDTELISNLKVSWGKQFQQISHENPDLSSKKSDEAKAPLPPNIVNQFFLGEASAPQESLPEKKKEQTQSEADKLDQPQSQSQSQFQSHTASSASLPQTEATGGKIAIDSGVPQESWDASDPNIATHEGLCPGQLESQHTLDNAGRSSAPPAASGPLPLHPQNFGVVDFAPSRLVALEARVAQIEARLASQDLVILQLQRAMMAKDAQLIKMEQAAIAALTKLAG